MEREYLVIGGTGMLSEFCIMLPPDKLLLCARFISNNQNLEALGSNIKRLELDYSEKTSRDNFLKQIQQYNRLKYCIVWVHSEFHSFSLALIKKLSIQPQPPKIIHLFGSNHAPKSKTPILMRDHATKLGIQFYPVFLGKVETKCGNRWMSNSEISMLAWQELCLHRDF